MVAGSPPVVDRPLPWRRPQPPRFPSTGRRGSAVAALVVVTVLIALHWQVALPLIVCVALAAGGLHRLVLM